MVVNTNYVSIFFNKNPKKCYIFMYFCASNMSIFALNVHICCFPVFFLHYAKLKANEKPVDFVVLQ